MCAKRTSWDFLPKRILLSLFPSPHHFPFSLPTRPACGSGTTQSFTRRKRVRDENAARYATAYTREKESRCNWRLFVSSSLPLGRSALVLFLFVKVPCLTMACASSRPAGFQLPICEWHTTFNMRSRASRDSRGSRRRHQLAVNIIAPRQEHVRRSSDRRRGPRTTRRGTAAHAARQPATRDATPSAA